MIQPCKIATKAGARAGLLRVVLILSLFSFSGQFGHAHTPALESVRTELLVAEKGNGRADKTGWFKKGFDGYAEVLSIRPFKYQRFLALLNYNQFLRAVFKSNTTKILSYKPLQFCWLIKTYLPSSDDPSYFLS